MRLNLRALPAALGGLRQKFTRGESSALLIALDVGLTRAALRGTDGQIVACAETRATRPGAILDELLAVLPATPRPKKVLLASRLLVPGVVDLPVPVDKPRPPAQMRELAGPELESLLAEFAGLWTLGALLEATGQLSPAAREQVTLEAAMRHEGRQTPQRFGETALALGHFERPALDLCLDLQQQIQTLDHALVCGTLGRREGSDALWLACGMGEARYREWREALAGRRLALEALLPLAWLASDAPLPAVPGNRTEVLPAVAIELHQEEVVAVLRRQGRVCAARSECRMQRALQPDWIARLTSDWVSEPRVTLEVVCLHDADADQAGALADDLALCTGHPASLRRPDSAWPALWANLARQGGTAPTLPRVSPRDLRGSPWANPDLRRGGALLAVLLALGGVEAAQRYQLNQLLGTIEAKQKQERERATTTQQEVRFNAELQQLGKDLQAARNELGPVASEAERLNTLVSMRRALPDLLSMLAAAVGNDAVLEGLSNSKVASDMASIQVSGWSPSYTGAQSFVNRAADMAGDLGYGVSQAEFVERKGRNGKPGHSVSFWLMPAADELDAPAPAAARGAGAGDAARPASGISALSAGRPQ